MPHERGQWPVLPPEFFCVALADPKARFCRSLAKTSPTINRSPSLHPGKLLTTRHLTRKQISLPMGLALPWPASAFVPIHNRQDAPAKK
jgi:hypothetical protein